MTAHRPPFEGALPPTMPARPADARGSGVAVATDPAFLAPAAPEHPRPRRLRQLRTWAVLALVVAAVVIALAVRAALFPGGGAAIDTGRGAPEPLTAGLTAFGAPFTYADGLAVEVAAPQPFTPSRTAVGGDAGTPVLFQVTVTNDTGATYRASTLEVTATSGGLEAEPVWDPDQGVELSGPMFAVPPGGAVQFRVGFAVREPDDVRLTIVPALYGYEPLEVGQG
ncbi:hypothetical protein [Cellulomonas shaoxiangyii]|uniref:DUF4352 domain-containing protein n=1 Tax=Cellulomonas shaoxiangyii TaxID=2566013 RepID=A0A4P7SMX4_9CELL|nr:hypothetical protein [Cellulomonas shaoxiangyii]QCB94877.1 hypothetical protein E5225_16235 [Cellulomonas shaoxiangyii]TGY85106.1 hypothetical protein E5226_08100 [Cellulomonas shaoxiangyii]